jgi:alkaline phosphatase D
MRFHDLGAAVRALACAAALCAFAPAALARLTLMHGFVDYTSALLWVQAEQDGPIAVTWRARDGAERRITAEPRAADDRTVTIRLTDLVPGTEVPYSVAGDGERRDGVVRTQALWRKAAEAPPITIAFGSCFYLADPVYGDPTFGGGAYTVFDAIATKRPDVMVWMGDNLYFERVDELDTGAMAARYRRQRSFAPLQALLTATSHVAIWDDHDYGPNDADMSYGLKGQSLALFQRYWANPSYGLPEAPGVFGRVRIGDVDLFLLDDRWYRTANRMQDGPDKTMFGATQLTWLRNALVYSHAPVKIVVNGSQLWNRATGSSIEGWSRYAHEQAAFAQWLTAQRIEGVLFVTGDRHWGELLRIQRPGAYPLYELTTSPLAARAFEPGAAERSNPDVVPDTIFTRRQFGLIRVTGPGDDRHIALELYDESGNLVWRHEVAAKDLRYPRRTAR